MKNSIKSFMFMVLMIPVLVLGFTVISAMNAPLALAGNGMSGGTDGNSNLKPPSIKEEPKNPRPNPVDPDAGNKPSLPSDPNAFTERKGPSGCAVRNDGKKALASDKHYTLLFFHSTTGPPGPGWYIWDDTSVQSTIIYAKKELTGQTCLYPSRVFKQTYNCKISFSADIRKTVPNVKLLKSGSSNTNYKSGSGNYNACLNANAKVFIQKDVVEYGFYESRVWNTSQNVTFEIPYTANGVTGKMDKPKAVSIGAVRTSGKKVTMTGSLDCKNGWKTPGRKLPAGQYNDIMCEGITSSYTCVYNPVEIGTSAPLRKFTGTGQFLRDGKPRMVKFGIKISGKNVKVNGTKTKVSRSGSPWDSKKAINSNLLEIRGSAGGKGILTSDKETSMKKANLNDPVWVTAYSASNPNGKTTLRQDINWTGTRTVKSVTIKSIDGRTGAVTATQKNTTVPTSGTCNQSIGMEFVRTIGSAY